MANNNKPKSLPSSSNVKPKTPNNKCSSLACSIFRCSKRRNIEEFYRKQNELLESFEQDSLLIQNAQQKRLLGQQNSNASGSTNQPSTDNHSEQTGAEGDAEVNRPLLDGQLNSAVHQPKLSTLEDGLVLHSTSPPTKRVKTSKFSSSSKKPRTEVDLAKFAKSARRLAFCTLLINITLTIAKAVASYLSGSLSIISSLVDSLVDITSGLVIWVTGRAIRKHDPYLYPVGRTRLEPVALIIVSVIMAVASFQMIVQSIDSVLQHKIHPKVDWQTIVIMLCTIVVKLCLFFICSRLKSDPSIRVLAQDHRNDCLSNSIAIICAFGAQKLWLFLDPIGAVFVALYIAITWYRTGREHLVMLVGRSAKPEFINRIIKVCIDHDKRIQYLDTVHVYHFGTRFLVEVHIVLDKDMRLKDAHDIAESLQNSIESLPEIERAFLHVDYEFDHKALDEHKIP